MSTPVYDNDLPSPCKCCDFFQTHVNLPRQRRAYDDAWWVFFIPCFCWPVAFITYLGWSQTSFEIMLQQLTYIIYHLAIFPAGMALFYSTRDFSLLCDVYMSSRCVEGNATPYETGNAWYRIWRILIPLFFVCCGAAWSVYEYRYGDSPPYMFLDPVPALEARHKTWVAYATILAANPAFDFDALKQNGPWNLPVYSGTDPLIPQEPLDKIYVESKAAYRAEIAKHRRRSNNNGMAIITEMETFLLLTCVAFLVSRAVKLAIFSLEIPGDKLEYSCFKRTCILTFIPFATLCVPWAIMKKYVDWSETFFLRTPSLQDVPLWIFTTIFVVVTFVMVLAYLKDMITVLIRDEKTADRVAKVLLGLGAAFGAVLAGVFVDNSPRNTVFMGIFTSLHYAAFQVIYIVMAIVVGCVFYFMCKFLIRQWILFMPGTLVLCEQHTEAWGRIRSKFSASTNCQVSIGDLISLSDDEKKKLLDNGRALEELLKGCKTCGVL
ncbi:MAG: hypothetical protein WCH39_15520 [Schlesneria sp.]